MIYRNEIMKPTQFSTNYLLNLERKQKYQAHLNKISEIQSRQFNTKSQAKIIEKKVIQLTRLKQFARNSKAKEQLIQRVKNDYVMIDHIKKRIDTKIYLKKQENQLRRTRSSMKFNSRIVHSSISSKNLVNGVILNEEVSRQNRRLIKSITENSFDQDKFRKTLKQSTKDYLKIRAHMRRIKGERQQSLKKLRTEPVQDIYQTDSHGQKTLSQTRKNNKELERFTKKKKMFKLSQSFTHIIERKLNGAQ